MNATRQVGRFEVTATGRGLTSRSGTEAVRELADRIGLTDGLSRAAGGGSPLRLHDPGAVLRDIATTIADGGVCFSDVEALRVRPETFGLVASDTTAWRTVDALADDDLALARLTAATKAARRRVWGCGARPPVVTAAARRFGAAPVPIDLDATILTAASEKQQATGTFKGSFGFHPLGAWLDRGDGTGEPLAALLRPGRAGSNTAADHCEVLDDALEALDGLLPSCARVLVRADTAGSSVVFLDHARQAGVEFSVGAALDKQVRPVIRAAHEDPEQAWTQAVDQHGQPREGGAVIELTDRLDLSAFPEGTRLIARRQPRHPGAQLTFDDIEGHRFTAFLTDQRHSDITELDRRHCAHARVEDRIRDLKDTGWGRLPSVDYAINGIWLQLALIAASLLVWLVTIGLDTDDPLRRAEPRTIRYRLLHVAGKITRSARRCRLHVDRGWPWAAKVVQLFTRVRALPMPC